MNKTFLASLSRVCKGIWVCLSICSSDRIETQWDTVGRPALGYNLCRKRVASAWGMPDELLERVRSAAVYKHERCDWLLLETLNGENDHKNVNATQFLERRRKQNMLLDEFLFVGVVCVLLVCVDSQAIRTWALRLLVVPAELQATHWHQKSSRPNSSSTCWRVISMLASRTTRPTDRETDGQSNTHML